MRFLHPGLDTGSTWGRALDKSDNGNDGTLVGFDSDPRTTDVVSGGGGRAIALDGDDDRINLGTIGIGNPLMLFGTAGSISVWIKKEAGGDNFQRVFNKSSGTSGADGYSLIVGDAADEENIRLMIDGTTVFLSTSDTLWTPDTWNHIVVTWDATGGNATCYLNGASVAGAQLTQAVPNVAAPATIGSWDHDTGVEFKGDLDEIRIYAKQLTAGNAIFLNNSFRGLGSGTDPTEDDLVGHWPLDGQNFPTTPSVSYTVAGAIETWAKITGLSYQVIERPFSAADELYRHHPFLHHDGTNLYLMWSVHVNGEEGPGEYAKYSYSTDNGHTWATPAELFPPRDNFDVDDDLYTDAGRPVLPNGWIEANGSLFALATPNDRGGLPTPRTRTGLGTFARSVSLASLGTIFWIQTDAKPSPIAPDGTSEVQADGTDYVLGDDVSVLADANAIRIAITVLDKHTEFDFYSGDDGNEVGYRPAAGTFDNSTHLGAVIIQKGGNVFRFWRKTANSDGDIAVWAVQEANSLGESLITDTTIPNAPSRGAIFDNGDGWTFVANFKDDTNRPYLGAIYSTDQGSTWDESSLIAYDSLSPLYGVANGRGPGPQYPHARKQGDNEYYAFSVGKEGLVFCRRTTGQTGFLKDSLISWWEDADTLVDAHGVSPLVKRGTVTTATGVEGGAAFSMAGAGNLEISDYTSSPRIVGQSDFTIFARVKLASKAASIAVAAKYHTVDNQREFLLFYNTVGDVFRLQLSSDGAAVTIIDADDLGSPSTGVWYTIIAWHEDGVGGGIQIDDGTPDTGAITGGVFMGKATFAIGAQAYAPDDVTPGSLWNGDIDQVIMWDRLLTAGEKTQLHTGLQYSEI